MQNFVKDRGRATSPQNGQAGLNRKAIGANAKIPLKKGHTIQQPQSQTTIPSRGLGHTQNSSAVMQQHPQSRQSGQGHDQKLDPYDTDAESLDTTVNHSVIQFEGNQRRDQQYHQQSQIIRLGEEASDGDEEASEEEEDFDDYDFTQEEIQLIEQVGFQNYPREEQVRFLQQAGPLGFRTVDGDSYPTTTNGEPTEWEGGQESPSENRDDGGVSSPSPRRVIPDGHLALPFAPQPSQREQLPDMSGTNQIMPKSSGLFHQSAALRNKQRSTTHLTQPGGQSYQTNAATSQPSTYGQANREIAPALLAQSNTRQSTHRQANKPSQHSLRQPSDSARAQHHLPKPHEPPAPSARAKAGASIQQHPVVQVPAGESGVAHYGDYDHETLFAMGYDELKTEDFDKDPRAGTPALTDDMCQKSLVERLQFVQKNFDASRQSGFFRSLPTTEWEDAGDWFLDQFQSIIQRSKAARQNKRKLAREFEDEVEKRFMQVSKKQHQVEEAMSKMKTQGEGLMPRSPAASKSPKPKRG